MAVGDQPVHCTKFSSTLGFYLLDAGGICLSHLTVTTPDFLDMINVLWGRISPG